MPTPALPSRPLLRFRTPSAKAPLATGLAIAVLPLLFGGCTVGTNARPSPGSGSSAPDSTCPRAPSFDRKAIAEEAACRLAEYIRIDTQNPGAGEANATAYLGAWLASEGIESQLLESAPGRTNLMARLPGRSRDSALMLVHHMDVVPARSEEWSVPPFEGVRRDGAVWGRGSLDNKGPGIIQFLTAVLLHRLGVELSHDLVLLAVADEEAGGGLGARFLTAQHMDRFAGVGHVLNEGGAIVDFGGGRVVYGVEIAQKAPLWLKLSTQGKSGHASSPGPTSAVTALIAALDRLSRFEFPIVVLPEVERLFAAQATTLPENLRAGAAELSSSMTRPSYREEFLQDPRRAALVRNTLAITMLEGSGKENVIPGEASAVVDLRLLPGQNPDEVTRQVEDVLADPGVEVERLLSWRAVPSSRDNDLFRAIESVADRHDPQAPVLATVIGGFTDCNAFRAAGMTCLGFTPVRLQPASLAGVHGKDEHLEIDAMAEAVLALRDVVLAMGSNADSDPPADAR